MIATQTLYNILVITFNTLGSKMGPNMQCLTAIHRHLWKELSSASAGIGLQKQRGKHNLHCLAI